MQLVIAAIVGVAMLQSAVIDSSLIETIGAETPPPISQTKMFTGRMRVPPKFLKEWRAMILLFASATRITAPGSPVRV